MVIEFLTSSSSASGSYPSFSIRSASSFAFRSAASKSIESPVTFLAPNFCVFFERTFVFRGPVEAVLLFRIAAEDVVRVVDRAIEPELSALARGDAALVIPLPFKPALRNGEGVRPITGGVAVRDIGGVGLLIEGLSHDEKKSSSGSPVGVEDPSRGPLLNTSVITTSVGYLTSQYLNNVKWQFGTYSTASFTALRFSSSLYLVAAFD